MDPLDQRLSGLIIGNYSCFVLHLGHSSPELCAETLRNGSDDTRADDQSIFLADASIARNIAFGVPAEAIDQERVEQAAIQAELHAFVSSLADGYDTQVGERGIRLSGGQRQRLGIARAIYKQAQVLVLDEATSALDDSTEAAVMRAVDAFREESGTVIIIAHRQSTIARCELVVRLEAGRIVEFKRVQSTDGEAAASRS